MKRKIVLVLLLAVFVGEGAVWMARRHSSTSATAAVPGRKILYYQSSMHPWIKSDRPGKCPICGMNLVPIYEGDAGMDTNMTPGTVTLNAASLNIINVQTEIVQKRVVRRTLHFAGPITANSWSQAWFEFTAYQRDLAWLKIGQTLRLTVPSVTGRNYTAQIKLRGSQPFMDRDLDPMTGSVKVRAEISDAPIEAGDLGKNKWLSGLYAESHVVAETKETLAIPRSAILSRGNGAYVYLDNGNGHYVLRAVLTGRTGDEFSEVLGGLTAGEKVVTTGNLLLDSEAQLAAGQ